MLRIGLSLVGAVFLTAVATLAYLIWPLPSLDFDWESQLAALSAEGDCDGVEDLIHIFLFDLAGVDRMLDEVIPNSPCATVAEEIASATDENIYVRLRHLVETSTQYDPITWRQGIDGAYEGWKIASQIRHEAGLDYTYWTDAISLFRCRRGFSTNRRSFWIWARDELARVVPDYVAPFDARRARCIAHLEREHERLLSTIEDMETVPQLLEYLGNDYGRFAQDIAHPFSQ